ncbi:TPA: hypothetical protein ACJN90_001998 [Streptococcus agalactiae]|uniref:hypothetical protein n=1 Tax=Streptococcus agalactiae TaxID=1311 RepID=UPI0002BC5655|nr:hypothetical protein [Streptococcus agalactiae]EPT92878.1 hypothetical protein SAG0105_00380 [Streptococcus agalactiae BSU96]
MKKYELLKDDTIEVAGKTLFRIKALISFKDIRKGEIGGYVEAERNLSQSGNACVTGNAWVCDDAWVSGNAWVETSNDYIVFKNNWSSFRWFTYTKSNKMWRVGCFYGTGDELIKEAYADSEESGRKYELYVNLVKELYRDE